MTPTGPQLSPREKEVLALLADGLGVAADLPAALHQRVDRQDPHLQAVREARGGQPGPGDHVRPAARADQAGRPAADRLSRLRPSPARGLIPGSSVRPNGCIRAVDPRPGAVGKADGTDPGPRGSAGASRRTSDARPDASSRRTVAGAVPRPSSTRCCWPPSPPSSPWSPSPSAATCTARCGPPAAPPAPGRRGVACSAPQTTR